MITLVMAVLLVADMTFWLWLAYTPNSQAYFFEGQLRTLKITNTPLSGRSSATFVTGKIGRKKYRLKITKHTLASLKKGKFDNGRAGSVNRFRIDGRDVGRALRSNRKALSPKSTRRWRINGILPPAFFLRHRKNS